MSRDKKTPAFQPGWTEQDRLDALARYQVVGTPPENEFDDIVRLDPRDVQQVLRGVDAAVLAVATKGATEAVTEVITQNLSERNREILEDEIRILGPVRLSQVEDARASIVRAIRDLEATGAITVQRGDEDAYVE